MPAYHLHPPHAEEGKALARLSSPGYILELTQSEIDDITELSVNKIDLANNYHLKYITTKQLHQFFKQNELTEDQKKEYASRRRALWNRTYTKTSRAKKKMSQEKERDQRREDNELTQSEIIAITLLSVEKIDLANNHHVEYITARQLHEVFKQRALTEDQKSKYVFLRTQLRHKRQARAARAKKKMSQEKEREQRREDNKLRENNVSSLNSVTASKENTDTTGWPEFLMTNLLEESLSCAGLGTEGETPQDNVVEDPFHQALTAGSTPPASTPQETNDPEVPAKLQDTTPQDRVLLLGLEEEITPEEEKEIAHLKAELEQFSTFLFFESSTNTQPSQPSSADSTTANNGGVFAHQDKRAKHNDGQSVLYTGSFA